MCVGGGGRQQRILRKTEREKRTNSVVRDIENKILNIMHTLGQHVYKGIVKSFSKTQKQLRRK